jgi:hypothetical protein
MTRYQKATESVFMNLTTTQIAVLNSICNRTLAAQPALHNWIRSVEVARGVVLPFLPIRSFRLRNVSRFTSQDHCLKETGAAHAFFSSGSTQSLRARHLFSSEGFRSYAQSACGGLASVQQRFGIPPNTPIFSLVPDLQTWPESSLAAMIAFWRNAGYPVQYVDVQNDPAALHRAVDRLASLNQQADTPLIIFGTSLHHLQVSQWNDRHNSGRPFIASQRAWCFDTGGTKGRTQTTTHSTLSQKMRLWFSQTSNVSILSEYGMCELSSQAYSSHDPHNGKFQCSPELKAFALSPDMTTLMPLGQPGFLAFIDFANVDSWPCIVSEDLGTTTSENYNEFELLGRAPDATLKGCSLNVRDNFQFSLRPDHSYAAHLEFPLSSNPQTAKQMRSKLSADDILTGLSKDLWPASCLTDLELSLRLPLNEQTVSHLVKNRVLDKKNFAIVTSANIPISWLYPALHVWLMGGDSVHLFLPAVRIEAPITQLIREQISDLAGAINHACGTQFVRVYHHRLLESEGHDQFDHVVVFGNDETVSVIRKMLSLKFQTVNYTGLGHFQNALTRVSLNPNAVAEQCLIWLGRGCLTPLAISVEQHAELSQKDCFAINTFRAMCASKKKRVSEFSDQSLFKYEQFAHQQNLFEIKTLLAEFNVTAQIHHCPESAVVVLDVSAIEHIPDLVVSKCLEFSGCGWLNIFPTSLTDGMPNENPTPGLFDTHQGRTWFDWLTKTETIGGEMIEREES